MIDVTAQPYEALLLFHGGAVTGLLYLLLRLVRERAKRRAVTHVCDALFVLLFGAILAGYLFTANYLVVRAFLLIAFGLGFAASYALFAPLFSGISQKIRKK